MYLLKCFFVCFINLSCICVRASAMFVLRTSWIEPLYSSPVESKAVTDEQFGKTITRTQNYYITLMSTIASIIRR